MRGTTAVSFRGLSGITNNMSRDPEDVNKLTESTYKVTLNTQHIKMGIEYKAAMVKVYNHSYTVFAREVSSVQACIILYSKNKT